MFQNNSANCFERSHAKINETICSIVSLIGPVDNAKNSILKQWRYASAFALYDIAKMDDFFG